MAEEKTEQKLQWWECFRCGYQQDAINKPRCYKCRSTKMQPIAADKVRHNTRFRDKPESEVNMGKKEQKKAVKPVEDQTTPAEKPKETKKDDWGTVLDED